MDSRFSDAQLAREYVVERIHRLRSVRWRMVCTRRLARSVGDCASMRWLVCAGAVLWIPLLIVFSDVGAYVLLAFGVLMVASLYGSGRDNEL